MPGLPLFQEMVAAVAQDGCWCRMGLQAASSSWLCQVFDQRIACRQCQVDGRSPLMTQLTHPFFQGHMASHQAVGGLEGWSAFHRQEACALQEQVEDTVRL